MTYDEVRKKAEQLVKFAASNRKTSTPVSVSDDAWKELQDLGAWAREHVADPALLGIPKPEEERTWAKVERGTMSVIKALGERPGSEDLPSRSTPEHALALAGYFSVGVSLTSLLMTVYKLSNIGIRSGAEQLSWTTFLQIFFAPILLVVVAAFSSILGFSMLQISGRSSRRVIHPDDYQLLSTMLLSNNQAGIDNWIRLSSLTGWIGAFTKVGLNGLPLATIILTITFAFLGVATLKWVDTSKAMFDMSKLTLGAFIGSYVQRQASERSQPASEPANPGAAKPGTAED